MSFSPARGLVAAGVIAAAVTFNEDGNPLRAVWERSGPTWARWNQVENYAENGFVSGLLYNMPGTAMERPDDYSRATMQQIADRYAAVAAETNTTRDPRRSRTPTSSSCSASPSRIPPACAAWRCRRTRSPSHAR
ncbi:hypothetical protein [Georgenia sp. SUBG003]|uniref:hypothetical protein n=1 Tax=Georgenia sp. SUBG003 TaxID=1497974 RepID=UPI003AB17596